MDHQRLAGALGEVDVPGEGVPLGGGLGAALQPARPVHVHAGLADRDDARVLGKPLDDGLGLLGECVGARRVQRDGGVNAGVPVGGLGHPACGLEVVGDGDDGLHADRRGAIDDRRHALGVRRATGVEVGVRVDQRGERLRGRGLPRLPGRFSLTATQ